MFSSLKVWGLSVRIMGSGSRLPERCDILQLHKWEFPKIRDTLFWGLYNKDPI